MLDVEFFDVKYLPFRGLRLFSKGYGWRKLLIVFLLQL